MARLIYSSLFYLILPLVLARLLWRSIREPLYRQTLRQRFGFCPPIHPGGRPVIWIHSVSAGETIAAVPLVKRLLGRSYTLMVTTMTPTGRERVRALLPDSVHHAYAPWDLPDALRRFIRRTGPSVLVIIDTELWPNMIHHASRSGARVILVNGRLSARSARGYRRVPFVTRPMLDAMTKIATQTHTHGERFLALGLAKEKLEVAGSIKFDPALPGDIETRREQLATKIGERLVFVAASTHPGEEEQVLDAFLQVRSAHPSLLLALVPRHPHRCDQVQALCESKGLAVVRHSSGESCSERTSVLLLDTMGELLYFYAAADIAFIGGSLVPVGGHNLIEAACLNTPIIMGPHLDNIDDIASLFIDGEGLCLVRDKTELGEALARLCASPDDRARLTANAERVVAANRGALERVERLVCEVIEG